MNNPLRNWYQLWLSLRAEWEAQRRDAELHARQLAELGTEGGR